MKKVIVQISGLTFKEELPKGIPIEATDILAEMADTKAMRDGVVAVIWAEEEKEEPKVKPEVPAGATGDAKGSDAQVSTGAKVDAPATGVGEQKNPTTMKSEEIIAELTGMSITIPQGTKRVELVSILSKARKGVA